MQRKHKQTARTVNRQVSDEEQYHDGNYLPQYLAVSLNSSFLSYRVGAFHGDFRFLHANHQVYACDNHEHDGQHQQQRHNDAGETVEEVGARESVSVKDS